VGENLNFYCAGNCAGLLTNQCSCQVLRIAKVLSLAKFISLVVQRYLTVLAIASSLRKLSDCLRQSCCVT